jgi:hypothetical protein
MLVVSYHRQVLPMDALTIFGLVAMTAMLIFYALEDHSPWFILPFAGACVLASAYGFLQGARPSESSKPSGRVSRYTAGEPGRIPRQRFSAITTNLAGEVGIYAPVVAASFARFEILFGEFL